MAKIPLSHQWREWRNRKQFEAEMKEELTYHLERRVEDHLAAGLSPQEARRKAHLEFGNMTSVQEDCRQPWLFSTFDALQQDLRFGLRWLSRNPLLTLAVVATLSLGIGANTAVFSLVRALLFQVPAVAEPSQVFFLGDTDSMGLRVNPNVRDTTLYSHPFFSNLQERAGQFEGLAAQSSFPNRVYWRPSGGEVSRIQGRLVSGNFFSLLGVKASHGRTLTVEDDRVPEERPVAVVSHDFWSNSLGSDPEIVGSSLSLNDRSFTVVGVVEQGFQGLETASTTDVWFPLMMVPTVMGSSEVSEESFLGQSDYMWLRVVARSRPGTEVPGLEQQLTALFQQLALGELGDDLGPEAESDLARQQVALTPLGKGPSELRRQFGEPIRALMVVVLLVLLIACANIGTLLLARAAARQSEMAARSALGAPRRRLIRQLLTESALLAVLGGAGGIALASFASPYLARFLSQSSESSHLVAKLDPAVLLFTLGVCVLAVVAFGLAPALLVSRSSAGSSPLARGGRSASALSARRGLGRGLVVTQLVLSLVLLTGAGLFLRTLQNLRNWDTGMGPSSKLVVALDPAALPAPAPSTETSSSSASASAVATDALLEELPVHYQRWMEAVKEIPGVQSVGLSWAGFFTGMYWTDRAGVEGMEVDPEASRTELDIVYGSLFDALGVDLLQGRNFDSRDTADSPLVAIVNQKFARQVIAGGQSEGASSPGARVDRSVVGRRIGFDGGEGPRNIEIVGLVADFQSQSLGQDVQPRAFFPVTQSSRMMSAMVIRAAGDVPGLARQVRRQLATVAPGLPVGTIVSMDSRIEEVLGQEKLISHLSILFGALALSLATIGLYSVLAYGVHRRRAEFGLRMALGAQRGEIAKAVLEDAWRVLLVGLCLGLPLAWLAQRLISHLLFGLEAGEPLIYATAAGVLLLVILAASLLPARRAASIDPISALREE